MSNRQLRQAVADTVKLKKLRQIQAKQLKRLMKEMRESKIVEQLAHNGIIDATKFYKAFDHRKYRYVINRSLPNKQARFAALAVNLYVTTLAQELQQAEPNSNLNLRDYKRIIREQKLGQPRRLDALTISILSL